MKNSKMASSKENLRQKAEELSKNNQSKAVSISENEALKLIHELQVHQIELELQNEELIIAKHQAEIATEKYIDLFDFAPSGYFTLARTNEIIELNIKGAEILGKDRANLINRNFSDYISLDSRPVFSKFMESAFLKNGTVTTEITLLHSSNLPVFVFLTANVKDNEDQCLVNMLDITPRKQMEVELIKAKELAEENDKLKTAFLQNMSHEIRTPMTAIKGFSELLLSTPNDISKLEKFTKIISRRCDDLLVIINDILDIAKIESGQLTVYLEACSLNNLFEELKAFFAEYQIKLGKEHVQLQLLMPPEHSHLAIITDKGKLKQIFINLITNALKFTNAGKIEVGLQLEIDHMKFYVSDTGIGIPYENQKVVFERFIQLKQGTGITANGTGLGLSIVKGLVNVLGGEIFLESAPGKGSTFSFTIPHKVQKDLKPTLLKSEKRITFQFSNEIILVVEDDFFNAEYMKEILSVPGLNFLLAQNGKEAVHIALTQSVDIILMDLNLPDMSGYEAIREIKNLIPDQKIIIQSAYGMEDGQQALDDGCIDYIVKPFNQVTLLSMLHKHLPKKVSVQHP